LVKQFSKAYSAKPARRRIWLGLPDRAVAEAVTVNSIVPRRFANAGGDIRPKAQGAGSILGKIVQFNAASRRARFWRIEPPGIFLALSPESPPYMSEHTEFSDDDLDDREYPDDDESDDDELETIECPQCGRQVYEEAEQCPYCAHFITRETRVWSGKPWWWIALALLGIAAMIWTLVVGV
jgi:hypothetical protein